MLLSQSHSRSHGTEDKAASMTDTMQSKGQSHGSSTSGQDGVREIKISHPTSLFRGEGLPPRSTASGLCQTLCRIWLLSERDIKWRFWAYHAEKLCCSLRQSEQKACLGSSLKLLRAALHISTAEAFIGCKSQTLITSNWTTYKKCALLEYFKWLCAVYTDCTLRAPIK